MCLIFYFCIMKTLVVLGILFWFFHIVFIFFKKNVNFFPSIRLNHMLYTCYGLMPKLVWWEEPLVFWLFAFRATMVLLIQIWSSIFCEIQSNSNCEIVNHSIKRNLCFGKLFYPMIHPLSKFSQNYLIGYEVLKKKKIFLHLLS